MTSHFQHQIEELKRRVIKMSRIAQYMIEYAIDAFIKRDQIFTAQVFEKEQMVNQMEIEIDDLGHGLLALAQPVAEDLRAVTTILKINTNLERISDHAVNIAECAVELARLPAWEIETRLPEMSLCVREILEAAIDSLVTENPGLARKVLARDDEVDQFNDRLYREIEVVMEEDSRFVKTGMGLTRIGHELERIGDLANNIAEEVVFMKQGKEVRHHRSSV